MKANTFACSAARAAATFLAALFASSIASAEPLNAKPGAWEMTVATTGAGSIVPPGALAKMPPEQRALVEKMMADRGGKPNTSVHKSCVKQEDLEHDRFANDDDSGCTRKTVSRTASKIVVAMSCPGTPPREGTFTFEAKSPESVVGMIDQETGSGKFHVDIKGRWLGASCAGIPERSAKMR